MPKKPAEKVFNWIVTVKTDAKKADLKTLDKGDIEAFLAEHLPTKPPEEDGGEEIEAEVEVTKVKVEDTSTGNSDR